MNFIIKSSKRAIASQLSSSTNSPHKTLISLLYYNQYSLYSTTSTTATASSWKKKNLQQQKQTPKKTPKSSLLEEEPQLPSCPSSLLHKKPSLVDWPRPSEIPWQAKVANSVNLIGRLDSPVKFEAAPDGKYWAATTLVQPDSLRVPVIFEGDLAHIAACHLKERDLVYIDGQLSADSLPFALDFGQSSFQVMVHNVNFVEVALPLKKSFSDHKISVHLENAKDNTSLRKLSQDDDYQSKESAEDDTYPKKESVEDNLVEHTQIDHKVDAKNVKANAKSGDLASDSWKDLLKNPMQWRDHRENKLKGLVKPKHPDFKHKDSGVGIWLNSAPTWVLPELERLEFDTPPQKSKKADDDSWKDLVENPKKWWDNRVNKTNKKSPDFKHKDSGKALWLSDSPSWAVSKLPPLKAQAN